MDRFKKKTYQAALLTAFLALFFVVPAQAQSFNQNVTVDSTYPGYDSAVIDDGEMGAKSGTTATWASDESETEPHWVEIEFPMEMDVYYARIHWAYNNYQDQYMTSQRVEVQVWDGSTYQTVATMTPAGPETSTRVSFETVGTKKVRFYQPAGQGPASYDKVMWLTEIDFGLTNFVTADSTYSGYDTAAIDNSVIDPMGGTSTTWASAESATEPHWVETKFDDQLAINSATIHWAYNHYQDQYMTSQQVEVQVWDGSAYQTVATMTPAGPEPSTTVEFDPILTWKLRFYQPAGQGPASYDRVMWLTEIDFSQLRSPEASFTTEPSSGFEAGVAIGFTDTSTDPNGTIVDWFWEFGDGNASSEQHPIHTYAEPGSYEVTLIVDDDDTNAAVYSRVLHVGGTVVDSTYSGYSDSVIDDGVVDADGGTSTTWASGESDTEAHFVELHFGEEREVDYATIHWAYNDYQGQYMSSQEVQVQMWDGSSYETIATMTPGAAETETTVTFDPVTTTSLRFHQPAGEGPATYDRVMWLTEIDYGLSSSDE